MNLRQPSFEAAKIERVRVRLEQIPLLCLACCAAVGVFLSACISQSPKPVPPGYPRKSGMVAKLLNLPKPPADTNYVPVKIDRLLPFKVDVEPWRYCWTLQSSTNLIDWQDEPAVNVVPWFGSFCLDGDPVVSPTNAFKLFRLQGTPWD